MAEVTTTTRRDNRTQDEWDRVARDEIVPMLQGGATMTQVRAQYGAGNTIRAALTRVGFNTKGQPVETAKVAISKQPKVTATRVADRRNAGCAWWRLELETGLAKQELIALLRDHGYEQVTEGRVVISERGRARLAKQAEEAAAAAAAEAAAERKAKAAARKAARTKRANAKAKAAGE